MEGYFKGYICAGCVGHALQTHQRVIERKIAEARDEDEI
jgi:hypothetical protein